ncbi:transglutaminase superfamily protein [Panacagrimonas perspica]|uniref:Transglutaminase superfamily protein n=1 Tax=Panacagrimonas perspica TaxID=381431 RepID=A0A4S3JZV7_9GAMM|nr:transglutaminase-like domain-containing protein [Panacagrimonas perspica]TDU32136.1 transglutaminase superfamily protein [Panacagrimonas perspica]THD01159.1 transglutaminase [Panacagrimonas perspica]
MTAPEPADCLAPTPFVDFDHPAVAAFAKEAAGGPGSDRERAVRLYYAIRDGIRYDPYIIDLSVGGLRASRVLELGRGWCVNKAVLLAAACRAIGIPARMGYADVKNHLSTERLRESMGTDVFYYHGYTSIFLNDRWVKATPAFNLSLCEKFKLQPLEFDGTEDSIYHPFDLTGQRHMEYLGFRGEHADVPLDDMLALFEREYPGMKRLDTGDFDRDVERETRNP